MTRFFDRHRRLLTAAAGALGVVLAVLYIRALFMPGLWFGDIFLYQRADGSFSGSSAHVSCQMLREDTNEGVQITFTINDVSNKYLLARDASNHLQIFENGLQMFDGTLYLAGEDYIAEPAGTDEHATGSEIIVVPLETLQDEVPAFPGNSWLATAAFSDKLDTRGQPGYLVAVLFLALWLALDVAFPDLFYALRHGLATDGGEPSGWYRFGQKVSRATMVIAIVAVASLSFAAH